MAASEETTGRVSYRRNLSGRGPTEVIAGQVEEGGRGSRRGDRLGRHPLAGFAPRRPGVGRHLGGRFWWRPRLLRGPAPRAPRPSGTRSPSRGERRSSPQCAGGTARAAPGAITCPRFSTLKTLATAASAEPPPLSTSWRRRSGGRFSAVDHWPVLG